MGIQGPKLPPGQSGQQFEWEKKIVFKMDLVDMVKFLSALEGKYPAQRPNQHGQAPTTELNILHESTGRSEAVRIGIKRDDAHLCSSINLLLLLPLLLFLFPASLHDI
jgi:hypothetical protein